MVASYTKCAKQSPRFAALCLVSKNFFLFFFSFMILLQLIKSIKKASQMPEMKGLDLTSFLITPVQRIPRYILLLTVHSFHLF